MVGAEFELLGAVGAANGFAWADESAGRKSGQLAVQSFFAKRFQFGECLQVLRSPGRSLGPDQLFQARALGGPGKEMQFHARIHEIPVGSAPRNPAQQVDESKGSFQGKVQTMRQRCPVPDKREAWGEHSGGTA